jgi:hypothetical protein
LAEVRRIDVTVDVFLYGCLAHYAKKAALNGYANLNVKLGGKHTIQDLLSYLKMPAQERGITFINGKLSAMPGLQPDLGYVLHNNDRVAFFDLKSMWPFQYRNGATMIDKMAQALEEDKDKGLHHIYNKEI